MKDNLEGLFERFLKAATCKATLQTFLSLCKALNLTYPPQRGGSYNHISFYTRLKVALQESWKARSLFEKILDKKYNDEVNLTKRKSSKDGQERVAKDYNVLIIGAGPCGLRTAIFTALLGAKTVVVEKRDSFSRNNVLHLWPFTIEDLKSLGAKRFKGGFCSGAIDHVSIRQLQLILMKSALIFGVEIHVNTAFVDLLPPNVPDCGAWTAKIDPETSPINNFKFHMIVGADGRRNTLKGFERNTFRGSLAIGITVNFINKRTRAEAQVEEISGINYIYRQDFFRELNIEHDIDLENIVYYKDDTHYFVMTARKMSLLRRKVLKENLDDPASLVDSNNIDAKALLEYALDAVNFSTDNKLPNLQVAINNYGRPDIALFDFTCMKSSKNASMFREVNGVKLLAGLVGDGLLEPFWPRGTGIAKGFLAAFDTCWMLKQWAEGQLQDKANDRSLELSLLVERENLYRILAQVESNTLVQNYSGFTLDPKTRYQHVARKLTPKQVRCFYITDGKESETTANQIEIDGAKNTRTAGMSSLTRNVSFVRSNKLLAWCEKVLRDSDVLVTNMTSSWRDGRALCTMINYFRPDILDLDQIREDDAEFNNQLAFDIASEHLGITPIMSGKEMAECEMVDDLFTVTYLSQFYELFKNETPVKPVGRVSDILPTTEEEALPTSYKKKSSPLALITKVVTQIKRKKDHLAAVNEYDLSKSEIKRRKTGGKSKGEVASGGKGDVVLTKASIPEESSENTVVMRESPRPGMRKNATNRISALGQQLISQFEPAPLQFKSSSSSVCYFCEKTVYIVERLSVEGLFFHRQCFKCSHCETILNNLSYKKDSETGKFYCDVHYFVHSADFKTQRSKVDDEKMEVMESGEAGKLLSVADDLDQSIPTIENGQVVMRKDLTPRRSDMAQMSTFIDQKYLEIEEEEIYEHNIRRSHTSDMEDEYESCDSELEDLDEFVARRPGIQSQNEEDIGKIIAEFRNQRSMDDSAFLQSDEDDVSSISSSSGNDTELMRQFIDEKSQNLSTDSNHERNRSASKAEYKNTDIDLSLSSLDEDSEDEISSQSENGSISARRVSRSNLERKDTLEGAVKHIREHPVTRKRKQSSSSSSDEHESKSEPEPQRTSFCKEKQTERDEIDCVPSSSSSSVETMTSKDSLESVENHIKQHPVVSVTRKDSSLSSGSVKDSVSSKSSDSEVKKLDNAVSVLPPRLSDDTSVWVDSVIEPNQTENVNGTGAYVESTPRSTKVSSVSMSTPKALNFTPTGPVSPEVFVTPCGASEPEDTFFSVKSNQSGQDISDYVSPGEKELGSRKKVLKPGLDLSAVSSDVSISETPRPQPRRRKLPLVPHLEGVTPRVSKSEPRQSKRTSSRRKLPVIPHLESPAFSPPPQDLSPSQRERIEKKLRQHEDQVMGRISKSATKPRRRLPELPAEDLSPRQRERIEQKLQKHETRVMERIEKIKSGRQDGGATAESVDDKAQKENREFVKYFPLIVQKRSNALRKKKPSNKHRAFFVTEKEDVAVSRNSSGHTSRSSSKRKALSSYSEAELHHRVLYQAQVAAERRAKEAERKRMAEALVLQGQLREVDAKRRQLEERGVDLEKALRGRDGRGSRHMHEWFALVQEKNALLRYENELYIRQKSLQLEDKQSRLERELRKLLAIHDSEKSDEDVVRERETMAEMQRCVDDRNELVMLLDEHRLQERDNEDIDKVLKDSMSSLDLASL